MKIGWVRNGKKAKTTGSLSLWSALVTGCCMLTCELIKICMYMYMFVAIMFDDHLPAELCFRLC